MMFDSQLLERTWPAVKRTGSRMCFTAGGSAQNSPAGGASREEASELDEIFLRVRAEIFLPMFFPRSFMVSGIIFKSFLHFEFILACGVSSWCGFLFWHARVQVSQHQ